MIPVVLVLVLTVVSVIEARGPIITSTSHNIQYPEQVTDLDLSRQYVVSGAGDTVQLRCDPGSGEDDGSVGWDRDHASDRVRIRGQVVTIATIKYSDTGVYTCRDTQSGVSSNIYVYVQDPNHLFLDPRTFFLANVHTDSPTPTNIGKHKHSTVLQLH